MRSRARFVVASITMLMIPACGGDDGGPTEPGPQQPEVAVVEVTPGRDTLTALGATVQLSARALDASGDEVPGVSFTWSSSDDGVVGVSDAGVATAAGNGAAEVRATAEGVTGAAELAVIQRVETVTVTPSSATLTTAGATQQFTAEATDANGSPVAGARFVWDSEDPTVATVDPDGVATSKASGQTTITATAQDIPGHADLTVDQVVARFAFVTQPTDAVAGAAIDPAIRVEVQDTAGNRVEDAELAITLGLAANPAGSTLHGTRTVTSTAGVATFSGLWLDRAGAGYTLSATTAGTVTGDTSAAFAIDPAAAEKLAFVTHPSDVTAGEAIAPAVEVEVQDAFGNIVVDGPDSVGVAIGVNVGGGTLSGARRVAAVDGRASFADLSIDRSGTDYRLSVEAGSMDPELSGVFDVAPAAPARIRFVTEPGATRGQASFDPAVAVEVEDAFGNPTVEPVSLTVEPHPGNARLLGQVARTPDDGFVTFDGVAPDNPGTGYVIRATSGTADTVSVPFDVSVEFTRLSGGFDLTCGVTALGKAYCWGRDDFDQVGSGGRTGADCTVSSSSVRCARQPMAVAGGLDVQAVGAGLISACALTASGAAYCWGDNGVGALGDGTTTSSAEPVAVAGGHSFTKLAVGVDFACGLTGGGQAYCWGTDQLGQLGDGPGSVESCATPAGTSQCSTTPTAVAGGLTFTDIVAGETFACGLTAAGAVHCWGEDEMGQLGDGASSGGTCTTLLGSSVPCSESPTTVTGGTSYATVTAGREHACSLTPSGEAFCWGLNSSLQLNGDAAVTETCTSASTGTDQPCATGPVAVNDTIIQLQSGLQVVDSIQFTAIDAGGVHTCAMGTATEFGSEIYSGPLCWGGNATGQTGIGFEGGDVDTPTELAGGASLTSFAGGWTHTCGLAADGTAFCWGSNTYGELGDGTTTGSPAPGRVVQ